MDTAERINSRMEELGLSQADLIRSTGAGRATVHGWVQGTNKPSAKHIGALCRALKTTPQWLLDGTTTPEKSNADVAAMEVGIYQSGDPVPDGYVAIDYYDDVFVSAGNGYLNLEKPSNNKMLFPVDLIKECNVEPSATKVIHVRGESMFPKLKDGQAISIDMSARTIYDGEIYAFQVGDDTKIKYLFNWNDEGKGGFKAVSANSDKNQFPDEYYSPSRIESEGISILGQYWWKQVVKRVRR